MPFSHRYDPSPHSVILGQVMSFFKQPLWMIEIVKVAGLKYILHLYVAVNDKRFTVF